MFGKLEGQTPWLISEDPAEIEAHYQWAIPRVREAAKKHGYAIGVHGSMKRDLDLIAVPWRENPADLDTLAKAIQAAASGLVDTHYDWEQKPCGRVGATFHIGSKAWIDLSVMPAGSQIVSQPSTPGVTRG